MQIRIIVLGALLSAPGFGAQMTWTGQITDGMCGANHTAMGERGKNPSDCTVACVKGGAKYAFARGGKIFEIANQDFADLKNAAGKSVNLTGDLSSDGKTITVADVKTK